MKIYTRNGDKGTTKDFNGTVYEKHDVTINANGTIDELNSHLGKVLINTKSSILEKLQHELFTIGSVISGYNNDYTSNEWVLNIENEINTILERVPPIRNFILPNGSQSCVDIHVARTVARRAERDLCRLKRTTAIIECIKLINRLSDLLFMMAYEQNVKDNNLQLANRLVNKKNMFNIFSKNNIIFVLGITMILLYIFHSILEVSIL